MTTLPRTRFVRQAVIALIAAAACGASIISAAAAAAERAELVAAADRIGQHLASDCAAPGMGEHLAAAALTALTDPAAEAETVLPGEFGGVVTARVEVLPGRTVVTDVRDSSRLCSGPAPADASGGR